MSLRILSYRIIALCLAITVSQMSARLTYSATPGAGKIRLSGELTVLGQIRVDGETAISGQTLFSGSTIETAQDATSIVSLGMHGRLQLLKNSNVRVSFDESNLLCSLNEGGTRLSVPAGINSSVTTKNGMVIADNSQPAVFSVESGNGGLSVAVLRGRVEVRSNSGTQQIGAGQFAFVEDEDSAQSQPGGKKGFSRRKLGALLLSIGLGIAVIALIFSSGNSSDSQQEFGGCVIAPSGMTDPTCP